MNKGLFYKIGNALYHFRVAIICVWIAAILCCIPFLSDVTTPFQTAGFSAKNSESALADDFLDEKLKVGQNRFLVLYHSDTLRANEKAFNDKIRASLKGLKQFPVAHDILLPEDNEKQISKNKHTAYVVILFQSQKPLTHHLIHQLETTIKTPKAMTMQLGGELIFVERINEQTERDLLKADLVAAPISIIILLIIFRTLVAAIVPMCLGGGCAVVILAGLYLLGHLFALSIFTLNIALLLGLCLSLDYSLFIISRFRDELKNHQSMTDVIGVTLQTAGKAVFFSGLAVFISLSALLLFPINILFSIGVGGLVAVFFAVMFAITLLPAVLGILKERINKFPIISNKNKTVEDLTHQKGWYRLANTVVKRPYVFFLSSLILLLFLSSPLLKASVGITEFDVLPENSKYQQFFNMYKESFDEQELNPIVMIVSSEDSILSKKSIGTLYDYVQKLKTNRDIKAVFSIVNINDKFKKNQYEMLYHDRKNITDKSLQQLLKTTTRRHFTTINIVSRYEADSIKTKNLIESLRQDHLKNGLEIRITGTPAVNVDVIDKIQAIVPYALTWIITLTYLILLVLLRSIFLPLKAIFMNAFSLCASYGVLVFIFQEGHLHHFLNFTPQGMLDVSLIIIIFCALFGFSMDYEVFLLTRIHESYLSTKDNEQSIIFGIVKSSRIITSAAIIVIFICGSFMIADVLMVKEFGLGIAVAIFIDAFTIRTILVPATMAMLKQWNWYLPKWLEKRLP